MAPKHRDGDVIASIPGQWISYAHTAIAYAAFLGALIVGMYLHYHKIVQNEHYGYPVEWFPSVSATIGDRYPERSVFMVFIAITSGPRFLLVALYYFMTARPNSSLPKFVAGVGIFRTLTCGGWTYVTSTDDHDWHDIFMISYLVATLPWTLGCLALSPPNPRAVYWRKVFAGSFFATLIPLIYFFIQHKVHRVPGAYTIYAFFEWSLVLLDVAFDAVTALDFNSFELVIKDVKGMSRGKVGVVADRVGETEKDKPIGNVLGAKFSWDGVLDAAADIYAGYVFWSILTSLGLLVWYFPLWYMGISGYEALVMTTISPFLLGIGPLKRLFVSQVRYVHLLSLVGLLAYLIAKPEHRLFAVGFGVWQSCLAWSTTFVSERANPGKLELRVLAFSIGLILSSIGKFAFRTNNPIWPVVPGDIGGWQKTGILLAILSFVRITRQPYGSTQAPEPTAKAGGSSLLSGLGLAGLFFAMHSLLSDSSTMILWVWEGWPVQGPLPVPHGAVTIFFMSFGLLLGVYYPTLIRTWTAFGIGSIGAAVLTSFSHWFGFYGALVFTTYIMAVAPTLISSAAKQRPGLTFFTGFFVYNLLVLAHVWVVAYAFVPGGFLLRERTGHVMGIMMIFIGCGVFSSQSMHARSRSKSSSSGISPFFRKQRSYYIWILLGLQLLSGSIAYLRFPSYDYKPHHPEEKSITAGIWTIHFALDNGMWTSEKRMADLIREMELDVVGLLESDLQRIIMGNRDSTQYLSEELGMYVDQGPGPNKHTWGCALLSKFPIVNSTHHLLPSPVGELAPAIHATIDAYGELVDVFVFHSGQEEDPEDRRLQSEYLAELMGSSTRPSILLSYLVVKTGEGNYNTYVSEKSGMRDIDPSDGADRWCEYILYKGLKRSGYARISRDTITDTELQVGKFVVGQPEGTDHLIPEHEVANGLRFPALFRGNGVRGHRYHVFDEPRYYA
ncbi:calcofluor white hypersensitive protein [Myriangium duriaei CBS 260.36]|uniref:Calcofluor white hypersensitive protein n=1 Tax=Myriangium duriaei CBS 260.36 TaxID=1168546 RepID=A0A9P4J765_9PEZI|nr:calcofluor white hypersensitive protein [Myriangium duriaei CBS 260.36]